MHQKYTFSSTAYNSKGNKELVIIDNWTIINFVNLSELYIYCIPLNINTIYLSQKYTKVLHFIRENCSVFVFFNKLLKL